MNIRGVDEKSFLQLRALITVAVPRAERAAHCGRRAAGPSCSGAFPGITISSSSFGSSGIVSFTPSGTAKSGTLDTRGRDGSRYAVRVLGATGHTRVLRYDAASREFIETF